MKATQKPGLTFNEDKCINGESKIFSLGDSRRHTPKSYLGLFSAKYNTTER